jgi:hypothetical protein
MSERIPYVQYRTCLRESDTLVYKAKNIQGERLIAPGNWWLNRRTPVGEDAELWERKPYQGRKWLSYDKIIAVLRESKEQSGHE